jgi:dipeptide/tripeptide permease
VEVKLLRTTGPRLSESQMKDDNSSRLLGAVVEAQMVDEFSITSINLAIGIGDEITTNLKKKSKKDNQRNEIFFLFFIYIIFLCVFYSCHEANSSLVYM